MRISDGMTGNARLLRLFFLSLFLVSLKGNSAARISGISREYGDSIGRETVIYGRRAVTFNTLSRDLLKKVYGRSSYRGLSAEQTVASIRLFPLEWKDEPIILVKDRDTRRKLRTDSKYVSLSSLFNPDGSYKVATFYFGSEGKALRGIEELDEKTGILLAIISGEAIERNPDLKLPEWKVSLELLYNRIAFPKIIFILLFCGALLCMVLFFHSQVKKDQRAFRKPLLLIPAFAGLLSVVNFTIEWILAGRIPLSNTGETLSFALMIGLSLTYLLMVHICSDSGVCDEGRIEWFYIIGMIFWGCIAVVISLIGENPVVTPLIPALQSPWLSIHVSLVMISYSLFGLLVIVAFIGLFRKSFSHKDFRICHILLWPALVFLAGGIVTGSIWAKEAWNAYWSWDPKETWALITLLLYVLPIFLRMRGRLLYVYLLIAFLSVVMTYFGVNYFLGGRHSYV